MEDESQGQSIAFLKRYDRNTSAMSLHCRETIPRVLKCSKELRIRTPIVAPITTAVTPALLPIEVMLKDSDLGDVSRKIVLRRKGEVPYIADAEFPPFPSLLLLSETEFTDVLFQKLDACVSTMCDFSNADHDVKAKEDKLAALIDLKAVLESTILVKSVNYMHLREFVRMIEKHIDFDRVPVHVLMLSNDWTSLEFCEPSWLHLSVVYQIFTQLIHVYKTQITIPAKLMTRLIERLSSPDPRERESLATFFCTYLKVFASQRNLLVTKFVHMITDYLDSFENPFAVPPALRLWHTFPKWFESKIKRPISVLIALANSPHASVFFSVLIPVLEICSQSSESRQAMIRVLVAHVPPYPVETQIVRILIISRFLEQLSAADFAAVNKPVINFLRRCATCESAKVMQSSFNLWNNHKITNLFKPCARDIQEELYDVVVTASISHWSASVRASAKFVLKAIHRLSGDEFDLMHKTKRFENTTTASSSWLRVLRAAESKDEEFANTGAIKRLEIESLFEQWDRPTGMSALLRHSH